MDQKTLNALNQVLLYVADSEENHYLECSRAERKNHIYRDVLTALEWFSDQVAHRGRFDGLLF